MIGVFVNSKHVPYARKIVEGNKLYESRTKNTLKKLVGKRVGIIETGNGYPMIVGEVTIGKARFATKRMWDGLYRALSCVPYGSEYDASDNGKWCYEMVEPIQYDEPIFLPKNAILRRLTSTWRSSMRTELEKQSLKAKKNLSVNGTTVLLTHYCG